MWWIICTLFTSLRKKSDNVGVFYFWPIFFCTVNLDRSQTHYYYIIIQAWGQITALFCGVSVFWASSLHWVVQDARRVRGGSVCALPCVPTSRLLSDPSSVSSLTQCLKQHHRSPEQIYSILCGEIHQPWLKQQPVSISLDGFRWIKAGWMHGTGAGFLRKVCVGPV